MVIADCKKETRFLGKPGNRVFLFSGRRLIAGWCLVTAATATAAASTAAVAETATAAAK